MRKAIILASGSPWRKRLLNRHYIECKVHISDFVEKVKGLSPQKLAVHNACGKAQLVAEHHKNAIVIGVDTIVVFKNKIYGKPRNRLAAEKMLRTLSGNTHKVISGLCVIDTSTRPSLSEVRLRPDAVPRQGRPKQLMCPKGTTFGKKHVKSVVTRVKFRKIGDAELKSFLNSGHWKGKAGSYAVQGRAKGFIESIDGDKSNVVGIPMQELKEILGRMAFYKN